MAEAIKVAIRVRPFSQREKDMGATCVIEMEGASTVVTSVEPHKTFTYDFSYWSFNPTDAHFTSQETVMADIGSVVLRNALDGFNGSLFAYGQTGSGKSYSVMGYADQPGIIPRSVSEIFERKSQIEEGGDKELRIWVSYLEIYNEQVRDLLLAGGATSELKVMDHPKLGVYIPGLTEAACQAPEDVQKLMDFGTKKRVVASTQMNATSSRSHAVFTVRLQNLEGSPPAPGKKDERKALSAKINLIDLAGSERQSKTGSEGATLKEGCAINQSLSALGLVIKDLAEAMEKSGGDRMARRGTDASAGGRMARRASDARKPQVAFRASKLTFLLKDSLAGNSKTYMIAAISPSSDSAEESISTLRFASSVKSIKTVATQNKDKKDELIENLQEEIMRLREQSESMGMSGEGKGEELKEHERLLAYHSREYDKQIEQAKLLDQQREEALADGGLSQDEINEAFGVNKSTPYLLNMAEDPMLAGCLLYFLAEDKITTIGAHKDNIIMLAGIGIQDTLCKVTNTGNTEVIIEKMAVAGRVCVNGKLIKPGEPRTLHHGDKLYLGRAFALKLTMPLDSQGAHADEGLTLEGLEDEMSALDDSQSWAGLQMYLDQVLSQMPQEQARKLFDDVKLGCKICDEANEVTSECRPNECLHFEVDLTSSVPSSVVIRVLQAEGVTIGPEGEQKVEHWGQLYLWSVEQMGERLERMRDLHQGFVAGTVVEIDVLEDPWHEPHPAEIMRKVKELERLLEERDEENEQLRNHKQYHMGKSLMLWQDSQGSNLLQLVFKSWTTHWTTARRAKNKGAPSAKQSVTLGKSGGGLGSPRAYLAKGSASGPSAKAASSKTTAATGRGGPAAARSGGTGERKNSRAPSVASSSAPAARGRTSSTRTGGSAGSTTDRAGDLSGTRTPTAGSEAPEPMEREDADVAEEMIASELAARGPERIGGDVSLSAGVSVPPSALPTVLPSALPSALPSVGPSVCEDLSTSADISAFAPIDVGGRICPYCGSSSSRNRIDNDVSSAGVTLLPDEIVRTESAGVSRFVSAPPFATTNSPRVVHTTCVSPRLDGPFYTSRASRTTAYSPSSQYRTTTTNNGFPSAMQSPLASAMQSALHSAAQSPLQRNVMLGASLGAPSWSPMIAVSPPMALRNAGSTPSGMATSGGVWMTTDPNNPHMHIAHSGSPPALSAWPPTISPLPMAAAPPLISPWPLQFPLNSVRTGGSGMASVGGSGIRVCEPALAYVDTFQSLPSRMPSARSGYPGVS